MTLHYFEDGGFFADGTPEPASPENWFVWHFTLLDYLPEIAAAGQLQCDDDVPAREGSVADQGIKAMRRDRLVAAGGYPLGRSVSEHVPWYIAAKSPMLFRVKRNFPASKLDNIVFLGMKLGDLFDSGIDWVASNGNASSGLAAFSCDRATLGTFVDFELLKAKWWNNTSDDPHRMHRRAAEILVHKAIPLRLLSVVVARTEETLEAARSVLTSAGVTTATYLRTNTFFED